jgi:hypothetical protein
MSIVIEGHEETKHKSSTEKGVMDNIYDHLQLQNAYKFNQNNKEEKDTESEEDQPIQVLDVSQDTYLSKLVDKYINDTQWK